MWVRILVTDTTMRCPACMTNSTSSLFLVILTYFAQISNAAGTFTQLRPSCLSIDRCKTGTIVTTIFQQFESIQQKVRHRTCSIITNNSAHNFLRSTAKSADSTCYCDASRTANNILQHYRCICRLYPVPMRFCVDCLLRTIIANEGSVISTVLNLFCSHLHICQYITHWSVRRDIRRNFDNLFPRQPDSCKFILLCTKLGSGA